MVGHGNNGSLQRGDCQYAVGHQRQGDVQVETPRHLFRQDAPAGKQQIEDDGQRGAGEHDNRQVGQGPEQCRSDQDQRHQPGHQRGGIENAEIDPRGGHQAVVQAG